MPGRRGYSIGVGEIFSMTMRCLRSDTGMTSLSFPPSNAIAGNISVYPNPAANIINLSIGQPGTTDSSGDLSARQNYSFTQGLSSAQIQTGVQSHGIKIVSMTGSVITNATSSSPTWQNDISNLSPGTYIIQVVNNDNKSVVGKSTFVKL